MGRNYLKLMVIFTVVFYYSHCSLSSVNLAAMKDGRSERNVAIMFHFCCATCIIGKQPQLQEFNYYRPYSCNIANPFFPNTIRPFSHNDLKRIDKKTPYRLWHALCFKSAHTHHKTREFLLTARR
jgi:hypothetical protein